MNSKYSQSELPIASVFHYTSQKGLLGILSNKAIWATNILYLNDSSELEFAVDLVKRQISDLKQSGKPEDTDHFINLEQELEKITDPMPFGIYVCSFSAHGDQLSQWRGYCPKGNGFSIGINLSQYRSALAKQGFRIVKCVYGTEEQRQIIRDFLQGFAQKLQRKHLGKDSQQRSKSTAFIAALNFLQIAPAIKDRKFFEENEWRLVSQPIHIDDDRLKFREGNSTIVPYVEVKLASGKRAVGIETLVVGPTSQQRLATLAAFQLLIAKGIRCELVASEVPYRSW